MANVNNCLCREECIGATTSIELTANDCFHRCRDCVRVYKIPEGQCISATASLKESRTRLQLVCNRLECRTGFCADRGDCGQANNHDQGQHNRVLDSGRTIFRLQKAIDLRGEILHG